MYKADYPIKYRPIKKCTIIAVFSYQSEIYIILITNAEGGSEVYVSVIAVS